MDIMSRPPVTYRIIHIFAVITPRPQFFPFYIYITLIYK